jgi:hypothetical protein
MACKKAQVAEPASAPPPAKEQNAVQSKSAPVEPTAAAVAAAQTPTRSPTQVLVFRNIPSWRRPIDFEQVLTNLGFSFVVKVSAEMETTDLAPYDFVIIPGAQWRDDYYHDYATNVAHFDRYVTNGGTLVLELNGAEREGITLPGGASMVSHGAIDNALTLADHPILAPLAGKPIHANYASHGYLKNVPKDALILATEMEGEQPAMDKPTFVEYAYGKGRVIAACQCFHDQDRSGRGPLMETVVSYAAEKEWFSPKK